MVAPLFVLLKVAQTHSYLRICNCPFERIIFLVSHRWLGSMTAILSWDLSLCSPDTYLCGMLIRIIFVALLLWRGCRRCTPIIVGPERRLFFWWDCVGKFLDYCGIWPICSAWGMMYFHMWKPMGEARGGLWARALLGCFSICQLYGDSKLKPQSGFSMVFWQDKWQTWERWQTDIDVGTMAGSIELVTLFVFWVLPLRAEIFASAFGFF